MDFRQAFVDSVNRVNTITGNGPTDYTVENYPWSPPEPYDDNEPEFTADDYFDAKGRWPEGYRGPFASWD